MHVSCTPSDGSPRPPIPFSRHYSVSGSTGRRRARAVTARYPTTATERLRQSGCLVAHIGRLWLGTSRHLEPRCHARCIGGDLRGKPKQPRSNPGRNCPPGRLMPFCERRRRRDSARWSGKDCARLAGCHRGWAQYRFLPLSRGSPPRQRSLQARPSLPGSTKSAHVFVRGSTGTGPHDRAQRRAQRTTWGLGLETWLQRAWGDATRQLPQLDERLESPLRQLVKGIPGASVLAPAVGSV
jgi:hypothetical protein